MILSGTWHYPLPTLFCCTCTYDTSPPSLTQKDKLGMFLKLSRDPIYTHRNKITRLHYIAFWERNGTRHVMFFIRHLLLRRFIFSDLYGRVFSFAKPYLNPSPVPFSLLKFLSDPQIDPLFFFTALAFSVFRLQRYGSVIDLIVSMDFTIGFEDIVCFFVIFFSF